MAQINAHLAMINMEKLKLDSRAKTMGSFKLQFSLGFVTSFYVIMNISIAWTIDKLKIT